MDALDARRSPQRLGGRAGLSAAHRPRPTPADAVEARLRDLGEFIRDQRRRDRLSLRKLSELAGHLEPVPEPDRAGAAQAVAPRSSRAIAKGLRISAETLYVRAGILDEREEIATS